MVRLLNFLKSINCFDLSNNSLSVYGTNWKKINLRDEAKLALIEAENKMIAIYVSTRRMGYKFSPEEFVEEMNLNELGETIMKRMHYIHDNNRL
jgi:hypothetical protein